MREGVTRRRMRAIVQEILSRPRPDETPSEFATLQVVRLNEALRASYSAMSGGNLRAVDRVVRIVRELDRYHGFPARPGAMAKPRPRSLGPSALAERLKLACPASQPSFGNPKTGAKRRVSKGGSRASFEALCLSQRAPQDEVGGLKMAPQASENTRFTAENGWSATAAKQPVAQAKRWGEGRAAGSRSSRRSTPRDVGEFGSKWRCKSLKRFVWRLKMVGEWPASTAAKRGESGP